MTKSISYLIFITWCFLIPTYCYAVDNPIEIDVNLPSLTQLSTDAAEATGLYDFSLLRPEIGIRKYRIYIPPTYDHSSGSSMAVIFAFHGLGGTAEDMYNLFTQELDLSAPLEYILVFPQGKKLEHPIYGSISPPLPSWNAYHCCGGSFGNNIDDIQFVRLLLDELTSILHINEQRVFATGFSNGAMFTYRIGVELSDLFAAIAPVAGSMGGCDGSGNPLLGFPPTSLRNPGGPGVCYQPQSSREPIPVYMIRGAQDNIVKLSSNKLGDWSNLAFFWRWDSSAEFDFDLWQSQNFNDCTMGMVITTNIFPNIGSISINQCGSTPVTNVVLTNMAHNWPTSASAISFNASESIIDFFDQF